MNAARLSTVITRLSARVLVAGGVALLFASLVVMASGYRLLAAGMGDSLTACALPKVGMPEAPRWYRARRFASRLPHP